MNENTAQALTADIGALSPSTNPNDALNDLVDAVADGKDVRLVSPASVGKTTALPVQFSQVLMVANRLKAKGVRPGTRPFRQLLDKQLKKLGLPVHNRKGQHLKRA